MFTLASSVPALLLAAVLIVSGVAKLRDASAVRESFITLQMPPWLTRSPAPALLPWGEIVLALALILLGGPLLIIAAVAALALFGAYLVIIARANRFEHAVECGCLGRLGLGVVGPLTVVRNAVLVAVSVLVLLDALAGRSVLSRWLEADGAGWAWLGAAALGVILTGLMVHAGQDKEKSQPVGAAAHIVPAAETAPAAQTDAVEGDMVQDGVDYERTPIPYLSLGVPGTDQRVNLRQLASNSARLLIFVNPGCGACLTVLDVLPELRERIGHMIGIHLVFSQEQDAENPYVTPEALGEAWFVDHEASFVVTLQMASPSAVLLGADGYLAGGPVVGAAGVKEFFEDIAAALTGAPDEGPDGEGDEAATGAPHEHSLQA
ncbi:MAG: MauE/DoxX family redox-associated membrane protein [Propionibacteriaceae bacterium]|nr:MauE/DoxX family redox-associated membrane protein [Propionibacteriaceae bacterium]